MLKINLRLLTISFLIILGAPVNAEFDEASMAKKIDQLVSKMTIEEKALLTSGRDAWSTQPIERLDIPYIWMADGPHGLRRAPTTDTWGYGNQAVSYTHLRAHETPEHLVCRLLLEKKKKKTTTNKEQ